MQFNPIERLRRLARHSAALGRGVTLAAGMVCLATPHGAALANEQLSVALSPNPPNITLLAVGIAQRDGLFAKYGVDVDIEYLANGITAYRGLEAGQVDVTAVNSLVNIIAVAKGSRVRQFYAILEHQQHQAVAVDVTACSELKGKVVAIDEVGGQLEMMARHFLATCNLTPSDVQYAALGPAGTPPGLMSKQASLGFLPPERIEEMRQKMPDGKFNVLATMRDVVPNLQGTSWAATLAILDGKRSAVVGFTAAMVEANRFILDAANKNSVLDAMVDFNKISRQTAEAIYPVYLEMKIFPEDIGLSAEKIAAGNAEAIEAKSITESQAPRYEDVVDVDVFSKAQAMVR